LSLSATDTLTVDTVESKTLVFSGAGDHQVLFDGSAKDDGGTAGTHGGFIYFKNATTSDLDIYIGAVADGVSASDLAAADDAVRLFTLKQGEFARTLDEETREVNVKSKLKEQLSLFTREYKQITSNCTLVGFTFNSLGLTPTEKILFRELEQSEDYFYNKILESGSVI
jgi:hypothetical protein